MTAAARRSAFGAFAAGRRRVARHALVATVRDRSAADELSATGWFNRQAAGDG